MTERDEQLELKKRARRRLVGAAAFALLAVIVLPMVMDETPPPSTSPVQIRIPGQDAVLPPVTAAKPAASAAVSAVAPAADQPATSAAPPDGKPAASEVTGARGKDEVRSEPTKPAAAAPANSAPSPLAKPTETAKADGDRAAAILQGKEAPVQHVVLIGAFADSANVKTLQRKLAELGIKTYTEALDSPTGRKTRVRAGPFSTREAAERARERMKRIGVNGVVATKS